ncbi:hypothetical protein [Salinisphaera orenii]|uniref:hypothetical protein n=1 Tax=Salinisphaera orenii TaxID=856731 RepID=UPI0011CDE281|nr:hypothetical protein [Salinisphaera halophila]
MEIDNPLLGQILAAFGGGSVVLVGLSVFVGKIWLQRIVASETAQRNKQFAKLEQELESNNLRLKSLLDHKVHIYKAQFDKEFRIYEIVWDALVDLRAATLRLRPTIDCIDPNETEDERKKKRLADFSKPFTDYRDVVEKNRPFYSPEVYERLDEVLHLCYDESVDFEYTERDTSEYFKEARRNRDQIVAAIDVTCEKIRKRINSVVAV